MPFVDRLLQILFGILLFVFPFSLRFLVYDSSAYRFGQFNPWVSEFVYLPEILLVAAFGLWIYQWGRKRETGNWKLFNFFLCLVFLFSANALFVSFWKGDGVLALVFVWRVIEMGMFYCLLTSKIFAPAKTVRILLSGALFQIVLALGQAQLNHSIGLSWLGEPMIGPDVLNVAKVDLPGGFKFIRPYGTLLHPNILAGYLLIILFAALPYLQGFNRLFWFIVLGSGIWLVKSEAAINVGLISLGLWIFFSVFRQPAFRRIAATVILIVFVLLNGFFFFKSGSIESQTPAIQERLTQNQISQAMVKAHPLGVGVRNFTLEMENFSERKLKPWGFQPVHNNYFLILSETGAQGLLILLAMVAFLLYHWRAGKGVVLLSLLLLSSFDHFFWDSFVGMMLIAIAVGFFALHNKSPQFL